MGITVLKINYEDDDAQYVGVTPGSTHTLEIDTTEGNGDIEYEVEVYCNRMNPTWGNPMLRYISVGLQKLTNMSQITMIITKRKGDYHVRLSTNTASYQ